MKNNLLLIGAGPMAIEYAKVLCHLNLNFEVVGRGKKTADHFYRQTGVKPVIGGLELFLSKFNLNDSYVIIATSMNTLMSCLLLVLKNGAKNILLEKPAALSIEELLNNENKISEFDASIYVAYNRRLLSSVNEAKNIILKDGGLESMFFEFTEWVHILESLNKPTEIKENWFFANSTHIIDLAFHLSGRPIKWNTFNKKGSISWHPISQFAGSGITENNVIFSYLTNWESAGRWSIELMTKKRKIYLKPIEKLHVQNKGSIEVKEYELSNYNNNSLKDGLLNQVNAFINDDYSNLLDIHEHIWNTKNIYKKILNK